MAWVPKGRGHLEENILLVANVGHVTVRSALLSRKRQSAFRLAVCQGRRIRGCLRRSASRAGCVRVGIGAEKRNVAVTVRAHSPPHRAACCGHPGSSAVNRKVSGSKAKPLISSRAPRGNRWPRASGDHSRAAARNRLPSRGGFRLQVRVAGELVGEENRSALRMSVPSGPCQSSRGGGSPCSRRSSSSWRVCGDVIEVAVGRRSGRSATVRYGANGLRTSSSTAGRVGLVLVLVGIEILRRIVRIDDDDVGPTRPLPAEILLSENTVKRVREGQRRLRLRGTGASGH